MAESSASHLATSSQPVVRQVASAAPDGACPMVNVGAVERVASGLLGVVLISTASRRGLLGGLPQVLLGGGLIARAATGHCGLYSHLGLSTAGKAETSDHAGRDVHEGILVTRSITVQLPPDRVYATWRKLENLPRFMSHIRSVEEIDARRSRWELNSPLGEPVTWEAEIIQEKPGELLAWQTVEGSGVRHAGTVHFHPAPGGPGTLVEVKLNYEPPFGGSIAVGMARLFGQSPEQQLADDLRRFKKWMEESDTTRVGGPAALSPKPV